KDIIISGGENISATEIENCLEQHPAISEVAVIGCPHPEWGEAVVACIVSNIGVEIEPTELERFAAERLARFKLPKAIEFLLQLPRTSNGKISKSALREMFAGIFSVSDP